MIRVFWAVIFPKFTLKAHNFVIFGDMEKLVYCHYYTNIIHFYYSKKLWFNSISIYLIIAKEIFHFLYQYLVCTYKYMSLKCTLYHQKHCLRSVIITKYRVSSAWGTGAAAGVVGADACIAACHVSSCGGWGRTSVWRPGCTASTCGAFRPCGSCGGSSGPFRPWTS